MRNSKISLLIIFIVFFSCKKKNDDACALTDPTGLEASSGSATKIDLRWNGSDDAEGFYIYRAVLDASGNPGTFENIGKTGRHSFTDYSVSSSTHYQYKVEAYCSSGGTSSSKIAGGRTTEISVTESFETLGASTGGAAIDCPNSEELPSAINNVVDEHMEAGTDVVFLIDNTGSMTDDIDAVKSQLNFIIANLPKNTKVGIAFYKDNNVDDPWYGSQDLTGDMSLVASFINSMYAEGGGDIPESVYDGLYNVLTEMNWRPGVNRAVIVIGDAPPLEGSLSRHSLAEIVTLCTKSGVLTNLYPIITSAVPSGFRTTGSTFRGEAN